MALIHWHPRNTTATLQEWGPLRDLDLFQEEMNRVFDWAFGGRGTGDLLDRGWSPAVDVIQEKDQIRVRVDLPGMKKDEIGITLDGDTLTISGEKKADHELKDAELYRRECFVGQFSRSLVLPDTADADRVEATYRDGVLEILVPKMESAKPKQIKVQA